MTGARDKPRGRLRAANALAFIFIVGVPLLSFFKASGIPVNLSGTVFGGCLLVWALGVPKLRLPTRVPQDLLLLACFVVFAVPAIALSWNHLGELPQSYVLHTIALLILCPACFIAGRTVVRRVSSQRLTNFFKATLFLCAFFLVAQNRLFPLSGDPLVAGSYYQFSGDAIAAGFVICYSLMKGRLPFWLLLASLGTLVLLGSRATFVSLAIAGLMMKYNRRIIFSLLLAYGILFFFGGWMLEKMEQHSFMPRVAVTAILLVQDRLDDQSLKDRADYRTGALAAIDAHPFWGDYGYDYRLHEMTGAFDHSILDVWAQYGFVSFLSLMGLLVVAPLKILRRTIDQKCRLGSDRHHAAGWVYIGCQLLLFRHPESVVLFFTLGAMNGLAVGRLGVSKSMSAPCRAAKQEML